MTDVVVLTPDLPIKAVLEAILARHAALAIPPGLGVEFVQIPGGRDGEVRKKAHAFLAPFVVGTRHALVVFDREGCGRGQSADAIEVEVEQALATRWGDRARCIVLDPELEEWLVGATAQYHLVSGLKGRKAHEWWPANGYPLDVQSKPERPKEAVEAFFRAHGAKATSANYRKLAEHASLSMEGCRSRSFRRLRQTLAEWFGLPPG